MTEQPLTQAQDHDRRIGRLEGIAEQLNYRLDAIDRALVELRQGQQQTNRRIDALTRWLVGMQIASLIAMGSLLFSILSKLPE